MLKRLILCAILSFMSTHAFADSDSESSRMHVQISNQTNTNCILVSKNLLHGKYIHYPSESILADNSQSFDINQYILGCDIVLDYKCGAAEAQFEVEQDSAVFIGHTPQVTVLNATNMSVITGSATSSSVFWNNAGMISIILKPITTP